MPTGIVETIVYVLLVFVVLGLLFRFYFLLHIAGTIALVYGILYLIHLFLIHEPKRNIPPVEPVEVSGAHPPKKDERKSPLYRVVDISFRIIVYIVTVGMLLSIKPDSFHDGPLDPRIKSIEQLREENIVLVKHYLATDYGSFHYSYVDYDFPSDVPYEYLIKENRVYYGAANQEGSKEPATLTEIDASSAIILDSVFAKDERNVFYEGIKIPFADPKTFNVLNEHYGKDALTVYYKGREVTPRPNVEQFTVLDDTVGRDNTYLYVHDKRATFIEDPSSFTAYQGYVAYDGKIFCVQPWIQYSGCIVESSLSPDIELKGANKSTFQTFASEYDIYWAKDNRSVYRCGHKVKGADPQSFRVISRYLARDKTGYYLIGLRPHRIGRVSPDEEPVFHDKDLNIVSIGNTFIYRDTMIREVDPTTVRIITRGDPFYLVTDTAVYVDGEPIPEADPLTFQVCREQYRSFDKDHEFINGHPETRTGDPCLNDASL
jgi:hypothetical protein